ncbi:MAG TPA: hypothetical protein PK098_05405 [Phycisphaerales bacterium]|nr:hypothetical protein [Phycisphaerales bacterium]
MKKRIKTGRAMILLCAAATLTALTGAGADNIRPQSNPFGATPSPEREARGIDIPMQGVDCLPTLVHGISGTGPEAPFNSEFIRSLHVWDDGNGPALYVVGTFESINGVPARNIAKWDGSTWSALDVGVGTPGTFESAWALAVFDDGTGEKLYVGGDFAFAGNNVPGTARVAKWDGTQWLAGGTAGTPMAGGVAAMAVGDLGAGPRIFVAGPIMGRVYQSSGGTFSPITGNFGSPANPYAMEVFTVNGVSYLYVGGDFSGIGGITSRNLVRYNGTAWSGGGQTNQFGTIRALRTHVNETGAALYAGGLFTSIGNVNASRIARLQPNQSMNWQPVGTGLSGYPGCPSCQLVVYGITSFDDGLGPALYIAGNFPTVGGVDAHGVAKWQNGQWHAVYEGNLTGGSPGGATYSYTIHGHNGNPACNPLTPAGQPALFFSGNFTHINGVLNRRIAMLQGCGEFNPADLNGDGSIDVLDLLALLSAWGPCTAACCAADLNNDAVVDVLDLLILLANWG